MCHVKVDEKTEKISIALRKDDHRPVTAAAVTAARSRIECETPADNVAGLPCLIRMSCSIWKNSTRSLVRSLSLSLSLSLTSWVSWVRLGDPDGFPNRCLDGSVAILAQNALAQVT